MSKKKPLDKAEARERRNRMLESAAAARLSLTEGVREMRAIAGMTQEEFARHRGVSARVIKAIELGQANPTVATMNRIGQFFGLEVAFVPIQRELHADEQPQPDKDRMRNGNDDADAPEVIRKVIQERLDDIVRMAAKQIDAELNALSQAHKARKTTLDPAPASTKAPENTAVSETRSRTKRKPRAS
ncbi:helix-turn-helix domain-containing protein [Telluria mixta]|uniref:Helix-turn-helix domain-containing protein n=1 Tax=Telluria mixta TaxID=34071 RepID=A0ABT2C0K1_9BURK|nr:helix-turn-helix domain-containing protein [Telluria mixta]MCS0630737.1 helix-turn-helix domain-containing protein [Telluria mixta]WEM98741.1 helix-turn-helix domain-containing protein [Telluria mixta]